ncbi:MAG TPA: helix-turn-helix domain-containing protein, partial [Nitrospira sp.]|nr:helix-turn-helix domain-containing protein [Nitrospira sp.]
YYRLNVIELPIPPLRYRREDIPLLVGYLVRRHNQDLKRSYKGVDNATMKVLMSMAWKGNVRELDNLLERAMILGNGEWITLNDLPRREGQEHAPVLPLTDNLKDAVQAYEKSHIENVLKKMENDKKSAAESLGMSLSSLYRKLDELRIQPE